MISTTFLSPTWHKAKTAKSFTLEDKKPTLVSAYDLGTTFKYKQVSFSDIKDFHTILGKCADRNVLRISGTPKPDNPSTVMRRKIFFTDEGTRLLLLDADSWPVPQGHSLRDVQSIGRTVQHIVTKEMGMHFLGNAQFCVLLSSSFWSYKYLRGHVYYVLDKEISLEKLHEWGFAWNSLKPTYKIDYSLFHQIQPDFVSRRICLGFNDPLPESLRLTLHCDNLQPYVSSVELMRHVTNTLVKAGMHHQSSVARGDGQSQLAQVPIGSTWEKTLALCGKEPYGINDPAYRGCAQLVQEVGDMQVTHNIAHYTDKVFSLVWKSILQHGVRGDKKDRDYYDRARFRGYIQTALNKKFGKEADDKFKVIADAIAKVQSGHNESIMFDADVIESFRQVKATNPSKWAFFRSKVKNELRGKVNISDIEKAMKTDGENTDVAFMINEVINRFEWIEGAHDNCYYMRTISPEGGYNLIPLDGGAEANIYNMGLVLFGGKLPMGFEKSVLKVLYARGIDSIDSPFKLAPVENRSMHLMENGKSKIYFNLGRGELGDMQSVIVTEDGVNVVPSNTVPVVWNTSKTILNTNIDDTDIFGDLLEYKDRRAYHVDDFFTRFRNYVTVEDEEAFIDLLSWMVTAIANTGTATLLELCGASKDGKSSSATFIKDLIDPTSADTKEAPDLHNGLYKKAELAKILRSRQITVFDNLSNLEPKQQDLLCSVATGWKYSMRIYYTQMYLELVIKKPVILTCLAPVITNQDLRSRSISVQVHRSQKRIRGDIHTRWKQDRPKLLNGLMHLVSMVLEEINRRRKGSYDMNLRDLWSDASMFVLTKLVKSAWSEGEVIDHLRRRKNARDIEEALMSSVDGQLLAFFENSKELRNLNLTNAIQTTTLWSIFRKWIFDNAGSIQTVHGYSIEIAPQYVKQTPRAFGIHLSKCIHDIEQATGWQLTRTRRSGGRGWYIKKEIVLF